MFVCIVFRFVVYAEAASRAIVQFLEVNQSEETSRGWMLLTTINLLASSGQVGLVHGVFFALAPKETIPSYTLAPRNGLFCSVAIIF